MYGQGEALAGSQFFLDALIDNHVGIHSHTQGEHQTGDTGQGEHGAETNQHAEQQQDVAQQGNIGNETGATVEDHHVDEHQDKGDEEGDETGADGGGTQGRAHNLLLNDGSGSAQLTGLEHVGKVLSLFHGEITGDFGRTAGDGAIHVGIGIYQTIQDDGNLAADVVLGEVGPDVGAFAVHGHAHGRSTVTAALCTVEIDAGVRNYAAVQGSVSVRIRHLEGYQFVFADDDVVVVRISVLVILLLYGLHRPGTTEFCGQIVCSHGQVRIHGSGIHGTGITQAGTGTSGREEHAEQRICHGTVFTGEELAHAGVHTGEVNFLSGESGPELQGSGALQEVTYTLGILNARQFDEDLAGVAHLLDIGLGNTQAVNTLTEHVEGVVDGALGFCAEGGDHFAVGGVVGNLVAEFGGGENLVQATLGSYLVPGALEQADEVTAVVHVFLTGLVHGGHEVRIVGIGGKGLQNVFQLHLQHHVHTALKVQTQVDFLGLDVLEEVPEVYLFVVQGVNVGPVDVVCHRVLHIFQNLGGDVVSLYELLGLSLGIFGSLVLLVTRYGGEGKLPDAGDAKHNGYKSDPTFALHFFIVLI